jgi:hypothetical protein
MGISIDHLTEAELVQLNEKIVQRLRMIRQMRAHVRMLDFSLGERVWFQAENEEMIRGVLVRYNKKSVTVVTDEGSRWTVSPAFLRKVASATPAESRGNVVEIEKAQRTSFK